MSFYSAPSSKFTNGQYNPAYFIGREDEAKLSDVQNTLDLSNDYIKRDGSSIMTGGLMTPEITIFNNGRIQYSDDTIQSTAYSEFEQLKVSNNTTKLSDISYDANAETTNIAGSLRVKKILFIDDVNNEQVICFTQNDKNKISNIADIEYDNALLKTTINNTTRIKNLICDNVNNLKFSDLTIQTTAFSTIEKNLIDTVNTKTANISAFQIVNAPPITSITGNCHTNFLKLYDGLGADGGITFPDSTFQKSAFTTAEKNKLSSLDNIIEIYDTDKTNIITDKITFSDTTEQTTAFSTAKNDLLNTVNGKLAYISNFQLENSPPSTVATGHLDTNFLTLYDGYNTPGRLTFPDLTVQNTAFTNEKNTLITNLNTNIQNISANGNVTQFNNAILVDEIYLNNGGFIDFFDERQYGAYTTQDKAKVELLALNSDRLLVNKLTFPDNSFMTSAFTNEKNDILNTVNDKTNNITTYQVSGQANTTVITGNIDTNYINLYGSDSRIRFPDTTFQNTAFTESDKTRLRSSITNPIKSTLNDYTLAVHLPLDNNSFITDDVSKILFSITEQGVYMVNGVLSVLDMNSVQRLMFRYRITGNTSPFIGIDFDNGNTDYGNFREPNSWIFMANTATVINLDISYNYRTNPGSTSYFYYQIFKLL